MTEQQTPEQQAASRLRWPARMTRLGLLSEVALRAFWPFVSVVMVAMAALMFGLQDVLPLELVWGLSVIVVLGALATFVRGLRRFHVPTRADALARLDETMPGRPIAALFDEQVIGAQDAASRAVWQAHRERMAERAAKARAPKPDLQISARDPYALRYAALLALVMAVLFGSVLRVGSIAQMTPGGGTAVAAGPSWEGWIEPPAYTGKPTLYLNDIPPGAIEVPAGSQIALRLYGEVGDLTVAETVSGRIGEVPPASEPAQEFAVAQAGRLAIDGPGGAEWQIGILPDAAPAIRLDAPAERVAAGEMHQPFTASDDYGVVAGQAVISLDLPTVTRRFGFAIAPEPRADIVLDLPMTISGDRRNFSEILIENLSEHPWAGLPVTIRLIAVDAAGQEGETAPTALELPGKRFFDPIAAALIDERSELLWNIENGRRVSQVLRAVTYQPDDLFTSRKDYLKLRVAMRRAEGQLTRGEFTPQARDEFAQVLWDIAVSIEDGQLADAMERLRQAQDKLAEAIRRGASDDEIAGLMDELREAMDNYMRQLAQQAQENQNQQAQGDNSQMITGDQLQAMLEQLQKLMEEGRTAEAQELLDQLRQMMENMQVAQGDGQGQQSPGQQAMNGLSDTLRKQQDLNDETFGDLQNQFGDQQGQDGQQGEQGGQQGQQQGEGGEGGAQGQGRQGGQPGNEGGDAFGQGGERGQSGSGAGGQEGSSLAQRQQALQDELNRQRGMLPGAGTEEGDAARDALDRAGRAMGQAEQALRDEDFAGALDNQSEAMEALRDGMRSLADQLAQERSNMGGQQGEAMGRAGQSERQDPLGRNAGAAGQVGTQDSMLQGEDVYRRARELLDEIRRRSADQERPAEELDYLKRLLERF